jgi:hypothetical protein
MKKKVNTHPVQTHLIFLNIFDLGLVNPELEPMDIEGQLYFVTSRLS